MSINKEQNSKKKEEKPLLQEAAEQEAAEKEAKIKSQASKPRVAFATARPTQPTKNAIPVMPPKSIVRAKKDKGVSDIKEHPKRDYSQESSVRIANMLLDPDDDRLLSLSVIKSSREAFLLAVQIAREAVHDPVRITAGIPLMRVWRNAFLKLRRSQDEGRALSLAFGLAHEQAGAEAERMLEEGDEL